MSYTRCVGEHVELVDIVVRSKALRDLVGGIGSQRELVEEALDGSGNSEEWTGIRIFWRAVGAFGWHCGGMELSKCRQRPQVSQVPSSKQFPRAKPEQAGIALPNNGQVLSSPHPFPPFFSVFTWDSVTCCDLWTILDQMDSDILVLISYLVVLVLRSHQPGLSRQR
jgi:hypothetical protein